MYCLFSREIYKYDPTRKQTGVTASQTSWYQQGDGSLLLIASSKRLRESRSRDGCTWCWGGREAGRTGEAGREGEKTFFFFTCDKSRSHMGGTWPSHLTKGWIGGSQWCVQQQSSGWCAAAGGELHSMGLWADWEGISSTALYNGFPGISIPGHASLNICSTFILHVQWSVNTRDVAAALCRVNAPISVCIATWGL